MKQSWFVLLMLLFLAQLAKHTTQDLFIDMMIDRQALWQGFSEHDAPYTLERDQQDFHILLWLSTFLQLQRRRTLWLI